MAVWTHAVTIADSVDRTVYTSGSFTPADGDLLVVSVRSVGTVVTPIVTGSAGLTFSVALASSTVTFLFVADQLATAIPQTVSLDFTGDPATGLVASIERLGPMALSGAAALVQANDNTGGAASTPQVIFGGIPVLTNAVLGMLGSGANPPNVTEPAGFTEQVDTGITTPAQGLEVATMDAGHTTAAVTWGAPSAASWRAIVAEFNAPLSGTVYSGDGWGHEHLTRLRKHQRERSETLAKARAARDREREQLKEDLREAVAAVRKVPDAAPEVSAPKLARQAAKVIARPTQNLAPILSTLQDTQTALLAYAKAQSDAADAALARDAAKQALEAEQRAILISEYERVIAEIQAEQAAAAAEDDDEEAVAMVLAQVI